MADAALYTYVINFENGDEAELSSDKAQVFKREKFLEVIRKDEETLEYHVVCYPWHTIKEFHTFGKLHRPGRDSG